MNPELTRRHPYSSNPCRIPVNTNPNSNLHLLSFNIKFIWSVVGLSQGHFLIKFEHYGSFVFELYYEQSDPVTLTFDL